VRGMSAKLEPEDLPGLVDKGLVMVERRLQQSSGARLYDSTKAQLTYIKETIEACERPSDETLDRLTLGVSAAREFETSDPEFADLLFKIEYLLKRI
jgi:hypothetical protein